MLSRKHFKVKKSPLADKRVKVVIGVVLVIALFVIAYGVFRFQSLKPANGQKVEVSVETGDRPLKVSTVVYINAEKGLSLRKDKDTASERLAVIPDKTKFETTEELDGWYKVAYNGMEGWISKEYTTTTVPAEDPAKDWSYYTDTTNGFKIKYPTGWKYQNYGSIEANKTLSMIAFSNQNLPATLPQGSEFIAPITLTVSGLTIEETNSSFSTISGVTKENVSVGGAISGTKYTYISATSNTQMTTIVFSLNGKVIILGEGGGYCDDLLKMTTTLSVGA
jgi:hypothetical protein